MKRKFLIILLAVLSVFACAFALSGCHVDGGDNGDEEDKEVLKFTLSDDNSYYYVSGVEDGSVTEITIPTEYKGLPVAAIGDGAFS